MTSQLTTDPALPALPATNRRIAADARGTDLTRRDPHEKSGRSAAAEPLEEWMQLPPLPAGMRMRKEGVAEVGFSGALSATWGTAQVASSSSSGRDCGDSRGSVISA